MLDTARTAYEDAPINSLSLGSKWRLGCEFDPAVWFVYNFQWETILVEFCDPNHSYWICKFIAFSTPTTYTNTFMHMNNLQSIILSSKATIFYSSLASVSCCSAFFSHSQSISLSIFPLSQSINMFSSIVLPYLSLSLTLSLTLSVSLYLSLSLSLSLYHSLCNNLIPQCYQLTFLLNLFFSTST